MDSRQQQLARWCAQQIKQEKLTLSVVSGDASFRRYFRFQHQQTSYIAMDAPPEKEDSTSFVAIAQHWFKAGIQVPEILAFDLEQGFLLLSDQGDELLLSHLLVNGQCKLESGDHYYQKAFAALSQIQALCAPEDYPLPPYDRALLHREMSLFTDWLIREKLGIVLNDSESQMFSSLFEALENSALEQDQVCVHRDFHSRNLMVLTDGELGVLDFQDAVLGPITYDLVSLLRDCYIAWPREKVIEWCQSYYRLAGQSGLTQCSEQTFKRWFDWMGLQRHLKAAGIFARLSLRDGKHGYLDDIPRTVNYLLEVSSEYPELGAFSEWLRSTMLPALQAMDIPR